jgi:hypothetical protein
MKITEDVRMYAAEQGISDEELVNQECRPYRSALTPRPGLSKAERIYS